MTPLEIILATLLLASIIVNIINVKQNSTFRGIFLNQDKVLSEMANLSKLLSSSTSNINNLISENSALKNKIKLLNESKQNLLDVNKGDRVICKQELSVKKNNHSFIVFYECNVKFYADDIISVTQNWESNTSNGRMYTKWKYNKKNNALDIIINTNLLDDSSYLEIIYFNQQLMRDRKIEEILK